MSGIGVEFSGGPCDGKRMMVRPVKPWLCADGQRYEAPYLIDFTADTSWVETADDDDGPDAPVPTETIRYRFTARLTPEATWLYEHEAAP